MRGNKEVKGNTKVYSSRSEERRKQNILVLVLVAVSY